MKNVQTMAESVVQFQELARSADVSVDLAGTIALRAAYAQQTAEYLTYRSICTPSRASLS
jgi:hypothetical protein